MVVAISALALADKFPLNVLPDAKVGVLQQTNAIHDDGSYKWSWEDDRGTAVHESGVGGQYAEGGARWVAPGGEQVDIAYTADKDGYHPSGKVLPVAPAVPDVILRAIQWIKDHPWDEVKGRRT